MKYHLMMSNAYTAMINKCVYLITIALSFCSCGEPSISIQSIVIKGNCLQIGVTRAVAGYQSDRCILIESMRAGDENRIYKLDLHDVVNLSPNNELQTIADSDTSQYIPNIVSSNGLKGMDLFIYDLTEINYNRNKHYYVAAIASNYIRSVRSIDYYFRKYYQ